MFLDINKFLLCLCIVFNVKAYDISLSSYTTKNGFIFPDKIDVVEGEDVIFRLAKVPANFDACVLTSQDASIKHTINPGASFGRFHYWSPNSRDDECGARIKSVTVQDIGRWRLSAVNKAEQTSQQSYLDLTVREYTPIENSSLSLRSGTRAEIKVTNDVSYCEISKPLINTDYNVYDKCQVTIENVKQAYSGTWISNVGVLGKTEEVTVKHNVTVFEETFEVGHNKSSSKIHLYCNLKNTNKNDLTDFAFCRFVRLDNKIGLRLFNGISNGAYSYYGNGLNNGDCGLTIENPTEKDFTLWQCSLGYYKTGKRNYFLKESVISLSEYKKSFMAINDTQSEEEVVSSHEAPLSFMCEAGYRIRYCIITNPNGTTFTINEKVNEESWQSLGKLDLGQCGITIKSANQNDTGIWHCQMGSLEEKTMDKIFPVRVRIGETAMVAIKQTITATEGSSVTLKCKSTALVGTLEYCRFSLENGLGFNINEEVTKIRAINKLYWYSGTSVADGDCQVTINKISSEHFGKWTCAGKLKDTMASHTREAYDFIQLEPEVGLTTAAISGIAVGVAAVFILVIGGTIYYRRRKQSPGSNRSSTSETVSVFQQEPRRATVLSAERERTTEIEMQQLPPTTSEPSTSTTP